MESREKYLHTRNYGCRIRRFVQNGVDMVSLENQRIKVVFAQGKGADIVEFSYKPLDVDVMWHSFNELKNIRHIPTKAVGGGSFLDSYAGGWQELFPTYGGPAQFHGGEIGIHGEACIYPWDCEILTDTPDCVSLKFTLRTIRTPFLLEKTVTLKDNEPVLTMRQRVTNLGAGTESFMWGHHPAFGWPFIEKGTYLKVKGNPLVTVPQGTIQERCPFEKETTGRWPLLESRDGVLDMSRAYGHEDRMYMEYALSDLEDGEYELINERLGMGFRMKWDLSVFRYLWIWGMYCGHESYPWYGRAYTMAVEPWSSMPGDYKTACEQGTVLKLDAGESMETEVQAEIFGLKKGEEAG